ncbi:hypothetical protein K458DRAFT_316806 [Lentithecium fluviatile CBS 122367]|uniref:Uncharacterized protein n=1 Tax=Lentithecium fluviatile CBS 122367 TaxID=1168545 RepID=A0A6G1IL39_9PLEO|nr:hypothetical protein K458DRAFT_316806 [Lentithecium fluviatile CBS 122367]
MSTEPVLDTILNTLEDLKDEVAGLTSSLQFAEERIARVERATFTSTAPSSPSSFKTAKEHQEDVSPPEPSEKSDFGDSLFDKSSSHCSCEIRRQLKPVNDNLKTMQVQLSRIEHALSITASSQRSPPAESTEFPIRTSRSPSGETSLSRDAKPTQTPSKDASATSTKFSKLRISFTPYANANASPQNVRPIFGHPSTPTSTRRIVSLDIAESPFGNYSDEKSPFSQLADKSATSSGVLGGKTFPPPVNFRGLSSNCDTAFGKCAPAKK